MPIQIRFARLLLDFPTAPLPIQLVMDYNKLTEKIGTTHVLTCKDGASAYLFLSLGSLQVTALEMHCGLTGQLSPRPRWRLFEEGPHKSQENASPGQVTDAFLTPFLLSQCRTSVVPDMTS